MTLVGLRPAAPEIYRRLMNVVEPALVDPAGHTLRSVESALELAAHR